jgi:hypothetical protein
VWRWCRLGGEAVVAEPLQHGGGVERLRGPAAGEQPSRVGVGGGVHVLPVVDELVQQGGERFGHWCGRVAEPKKNLVVLVENVVDGQAQEAADWA